MLKLWLYKTTVVHSPLSPDYKACIFDIVDGFMNQYSMVSITQRLHFILTKHGSSLCGYVNRQNNRCWSTENAHAAHEVPLRNLKAGIWCSVGA
jgi:hypothetical protein